MGVERSKAFVERDRVKKSIEELMDGGEEGKDRRKRARKLGVMAKEALEEWGSSYLNISLLIQDVLQMNIPGVFVSIITTPINAIRYKGVIEYSKSQNLKIQMIPINFPCQEAGLPDGCENLDTLLNSLELSREFFQACEMLQTPLENLILELNPKPNCLISTRAIPWTQNIARKFNIPRYNFETVSCFTLFCSDKLSRAKFQESVVSVRELFPAQLPKTAKNGFEDIIDQIKQAQDSAQGTLVNSFQELEPWYLENYRREKGKVYCIGPVSICNKAIPDRFNRGNQAEIDEHYCQTWLNSMRPKSVIYACFGSLCRISGPQMKKLVRAWKNRISLSFGLSESRIIRKKLRIGWRKRGLRREYEEEGSWYESGPHKS
ncbi:hypothetical protein DH2020_040005 [Rehmannia glutinosa]|uniref:Uncharacterized protein n=1 Tax=Rehmannia glutinosa TaxID=99300 RepID=A0ABR0UU92_REHGL